MKTVVLLFFLASTALLSQPVRAQSDASGPVTTTTTTTTTTAIASSAGQAVDIARGAVDPSLQDRLISVYGVGSPEAIARWWVIFYDPSVPSHGRAVKVENGQVGKAYEAKGGVVYSHDLTFPRAWVTGEGAALAATQQYATQHGITYDGVRALLRITANGQTLRWRVEMLDAGVNKGFVFVSAANGSFALYAPPGALPSGTHTGTGDGGVVGDARKFGNDVKNTFLGIGGDLQEFFTGERTVDQ